VLFRNLKDKSLVRCGLAAVSLVAALTISVAASAAGYSRTEDFGAPGRDDFIDRVVTIAPDAKWVNVTQNETIKFVDVSSGKSFVWRFDATKRFDLTRVSPSGVLDGRHIEVFVNPDPRHNSGG
jgi:hypothetical protein